MKTITCRAITILLLLVATVSRAGSPPPVLGTLGPGDFRNIHQDLNVNIVLVGFEAGPGDDQIVEDDLLSVLPATYRPVNRFPSFYFGNQFLGLSFAFDYTITYADQDFEDDFFGQLAAMCVGMPVTLFQEFYNNQAAASLTISENCWIDAPTVEQWLANNAPPGVDTTEYTVFLINWYGRDDFRHHVYTKIDEPDADTGYNFGLLRDSRKMTAWGGTAPDDEESGYGSLARIWFYDLSAGPEGWTDNWNLDSSGGYTIPPVWEYGNAGYRNFDDLSFDLGLVIRFVAIDLLFTTSPLYKPALSPPKLPEEIQVDINLYQIDSTFDAMTLFDTALIAAEVGDLLPHNIVSVELKEASFDSRASDVYNCFSAGQASCFGYRLFGISFGDLFLFHDDRLLQYLEGDADYEIPVFAYYDSVPLGAGGFLGFADDDWATGTQSYIFEFDDPFLQFLGYGFSTTTIHETGHHVGLSHPHDGYDYEIDFDFGPSGPVQFAWLGDMSNSVMSYIDLNWDFSQFDRDNMNRFTTSVFINQANSVLADIYSSPRAGQAGDTLIAADNNAAVALAHYDAMDYLAAAMHAKLAYEQVLDAAASINVKVEPQAFEADYKSKGNSRKFVDSVDYQRNKP